MQSKTRVPCRSIGRGVALAAAVLTSSLLLPAQDPPAAKWDKAIAAFEEQDRLTPPAKEANLFVGSSTARMWKLDESFPGLQCLNRGFGGSQLADVVMYVDRIVIPYRPRVIALYAGDNDVAQGRTPEQIRDSYRTFVAKVQAALPETKIVWIAIKPSPKRWHLRDAAQLANALIRAEIAKGKNQIEVDVWQVMLGDDGQPRAELYVQDQLHLSGAGYTIWNERVRQHLISE